MIRKVLLAVCLVLTAFEAARAGIPTECELAILPNLIASPNGTIPTTFTFHGPSGPVSGLIIEVRYTAVAENLACWCSGQVHPVLSDTTDAAGQVRFFISGGGCLEPAVIPGGVAVVVSLNGIPCREIGQVSPDVLNSTSPPCQVTLGDAVSYTHPLATATYGFCYDLNSDLAVGLTDAVIFTTPASRAATCP